KLEVEMWNLKVKSADVVGYNQCCQELALMCARMFPEESDKIKKYVSDAIEFATELMDKKINTLAEGQAENKRKLDNNNQAQQQPPKKETSLAMNVRMKGTTGVIAQSERTKTMKTKLEGKLNPRYVEPSKVIEKGGSVAYKIKLPQELSRVHHTFRVSNLKKCYTDEPLAVPLDRLHIDDKLHFIEEPVEIMDREVKRLKQSRILIVKVRWNSRRGPEFTWERKDQFWKKYPHLFTKIAPSSSATS
ncbi:hypothetical protein Tco_1435207, partial [Tanacetum coccineum]